MSVRVIPPAAPSGGGSRTLIPFTLAVAGFDDIEVIPAPTVIPSSKILVYPDSSDDFAENDLSGIEWVYSVLPQTGAFQIEVGFTQPQSGQLNLLYEVI